MLRMDLSKLLMKQLKNMLISKIGIEEYMQRWDEMDQGIGLIIEALKKEKIR